MTYSDGVVGMWSGENDGARRCRSVRLFCCKERRSGIWKAWLGLEYDWSCGEMSGKLGLGFPARE